MKFTVITFLLALSGILAVQEPPVLDTRFGQEIIVSSPINGDVYLAGKKITINAPIRGDLVVAGGSVIINDSVTADVLVAGGDVSINGYVGDDIRAAAGSLRVSGNVAGDVLIGGGEFTLQRSATLEGNLVASGGQIEILGHIKGAAKTVFQKLTFKGIVDGPFDARGQDMHIAGTLNGYSAISAPTITILPDAKFARDVRYWNNQGSIDISPETRNIRVTYDPSIKVEQERWELLGFTSLLMVSWYLGTALVMIWAMEFLFSKTFLNAAGVARQQSLGSIGYGLLFYLGLPVLCLILGITIVAIPIAAILLIAYIIVIILVTAITAIVISNWINRMYYQSSWKVSQVALVAFGIFVALKLFTMTPIVGPIIMLIMACMATGSIVISAWNSKKLNSRP